MIKNWCHVLVIYCVTDMTYWFFPNIEYFANAVTTHLHEQKLTVG